MFLFSEMMMMMMMMKKKKKKNVKVEGKEGKKEIHLLHDVCCYLKEPKK